MTRRLAFIRHVGPYEDVPPSLFEELLDWASRIGEDGGHLERLGAAMG